MDGGSAWVVGQLGTTARMVLPLTEWAIGADAGLVVSAVRGDTSSTMIVRELATGSVVRTFQTSVTGLQNRGALVGANLFWTGTDAGSGRDAGVWTLDLSQPAAAGIAEKLIDQQVRDVEIGKSHVGIGVVYRGKLTSPASRMPGWLWPDSVRAVYS